MFAIRAVRSDVTVGCLRGKSYDIGVTEVQLRRHQPFFFNAVTCSSSASPGE
jgi:hypothetical protein